MSVASCLIHMVSHKTPKIPYLLHVPVYFLTFLFNKLSTYSWDSATFREEEKRENFFVSFTTMQYNTKITISASAEHLKVET